ncbi:MAG: PHP domain-containing protein [Thermoguttaceae bacterium]|nr:PHP domain-containing protein [Thermoguttaceae bacterium]
MNNVGISKKLEQTARLLEFLEGRSPLTDELARAAERVALLEVPLEFFASAATAELDAALGYWFRGFSPDVVWALRETVATGTSAIFERAARAVGSTVVELARVRSLDLRAVGFLRDAFGVRDLDSLKRACEASALSRSREFSPDAELDILDDIYLLNALDGANGGFASDSFGSEFARVAPFDEPALPLADPNLLFSANAEALADFVVSELRDPTKKRDVATAAKELVSEFVSKERLDLVRDQARGVVGKIRRFFMPRDNPENARLRWEEERRRARETRRRETASENRGTATMENGSGRAGRSEKTSAAVAPDARVEAVGPLGRKTDAVARLDFLIETDDPKATFERIKSADFVKETLAEDARFLAVSFRASAFDLPFNGRPTPEVRLCFYAATDFVWGARKLYLSSTPKHWDALRKRAEERGWRLTSLGLYSGARRLGSRTERKIYEKLGLPEIPVELREGRVENDWVAAGTPELLTPADLRGDLHSHTDFTDGTGSLEEMVAAARRLGLEYLAATDHSKNVVSVGGMNDGEFLRYWDYIDELNAVLRGEGIDFRVLKGAEVDILDDGELDLKDETLARADWVVASLHFGLEQSAERLRRRYEGAFRNPFVDVIGHPTERVIGAKASIAIEFDFLVESAARFGKRLELNSQPRRLDLNVDGLIAAKKAGVAVVVSTDAHSPAHLAYRRFGVEQARRAGLTRTDVANALSLDELLKSRVEARARAARN